MTRTGPYRLSNSQMISERLRLLSDIAASNRLLDRYLDLVSAMERGLTAAPEDWGDPVFRYQNLGLDVYRRALEMIVVTYTVDPIRRIVYIQDIQPMTGGGLDLLP
jgi:hypothetical protein